MKKLIRILIVTVTVSLCVGAIVDVQAKSDAVDKGIKAYCIDFNWGEGGPNGFARPGLWADADPEEHVAWYKSLGANVIQTFAVSCNGYAWYKNGVAPEQPGLKHDFLTEMVRLGHGEGMMVMGYFCVGSNTRWGQLNPEESYGVPADGHIPFTKKYNKFLGDSIKDALLKTDMDGFMIDWLFHGPIHNTNIKWLDCEIEMWGELMEGRFPGKGKVTKAQELEFARRSVDRCWQSIRMAAKSVKQDCIIWLSLYKLNHPQVMNSRVIKEVDWLMNEGGTVEELGKIRKELGRGNLINCLAAWNKADPRAVVPASIEAGFGLYGFTKPVKGSLLPSIDDYYLAKDIDELAGDEANVAMLARAYRGVSSGSVSLFNGRDLSGWHVDVPKMDNNADVKSPFIVRDGMLVSMGSPGGHIITDAEYSNYRLEVEYRFASKPGNCGVLVHASTPRSLYKMFPKSVEVQMMHKNAGDFWCIVEDITVPDMVARRGPRETWGIVEGKSRRIMNLTDDSEKPAGEWNRMVIECVGDSVKVWVNGDLVNHGTGCTASKGQIALQAEGSEVEFRRVLLSPVKKSGDFKFEPTWESLKGYETPEWNMDGKFGIFIHWGVYAVPAAGSEWYPRNMYNKDDKLFEYHKKTWGDQSKFGYKDFVPKFLAEKWDPESWAELFKKSGATYVVPVAEHHDGFAMYDSSHTRWNSVDMGPRRDICGELSKAVRKRGMKFGVSTHYAWNWRYYFKDPSFDNVNPGYADLYGVNHAPDAKASPVFIEHWYARTKELIDNYQPDLIWFDFGFCHPEFEQGRKEIAAYYYNKGIEWDKGVALNYKRWTKPSVGVTEVAFPEGAGTLDLEREKSPNIRDFFWQTDTSISTKSWGYIENDTFKSPDRLIDDLIDIVSKNGCLLLNVGPAADGAIPQEAQDILLKMGEWLGKNGKAVYKTRPWKISGEGPTGTAQGHLSENKNKAFTAEDIRYTQDGENLYAVALDWPKTGKLVIKTLGTDMKVGGEGIETVSLLSTGKKLKWSRDAAGLSITLPKTKPGDYAYVFKITPKGGLVTD